MSEAESGTVDTGMGSSDEHGPGGGTFFFLGFTLGLITVVGATFIILMFAVDPAVSDQAVATNAARSPATTVVDDIAAGMVLAESAGCVACHSADGTELIGPTWVGVAGSERTFEDGSTRMADDEYLRESIVDPPVQVVAGFPGNVMPATYATSLSSAEIEQLVAYINSLGG